MLTQKRLKKLINYDPLTGTFTWRVRRGSARKGDIITCRDSDGYVVVMVDRKLMKSHRLAILYMDGYLPENTVDHRNRIRHDNRYKNLREASNQCQSRNRPPSSRNTSGIKGVYWSAADKKWKSGVCVNGERKHLGTFTDLENAVYHRYAAEQCLGFPDCDINSSAKQYIDKMDILSHWSAM